MDITNAMNGAMPSRRVFLAGAAAVGLLALPGCQSFGRYSLIEAVRRLLLVSADRAFARLTAPGGFWDNQVARLDLPDIFGTRGNILGSILTSALFKERLQREFNHVAERGARRAAPVVAEAVSRIGLANAKALLDGRPDAATSYLRGEMSGALIDVMVPELSDALRISQEPLVGQALRALTGVDIGTVANDFAADVDDAIWREMGREEAEIRANPRSTNDPVLIGVLGVA